MSNQALKLSSMHCEVPFGAKGCKMCFVVIKNMSAGQKRAKNMLTLCYGCVVAYLHSYLHSHHSANLFSNSCNIICVTKSTQSVDWCPPPFQTLSGYVFQWICWLLPTVFQSMSLHVFGHPKSLALCQVLIQMYRPLVNGINGTKTFVDCRNLEWHLHVLWVLPNQPNQWRSAHLGVHFPCTWTDEGAWGWHQLWP